MPVSLWETEVGPGRRQGGPCGEGLAELPAKERGEVLLERAGVERRKYLDPPQEPEQHQVPIRVELSE